MACPALPYFFPHYLINGTIFGEEILLNIQCTCFFSITFEHFPFYEEFCEIYIYKGLHVKTLMKLEFSQYIFEKLTYITFQEIPASVSRVVSCGCTKGRTDRQTDITKLTATLGTFANAHKIPLPRISHLPEQ